MKRLVSFLLVLVIVFSLSSAFADRYIFAHYSLFLDGQFYNSLLGGGFSFDTRMIDLYIYDDFSGGYMMNEQWSGGRRSVRGPTEFTYQKTGYPHFTIVFDDGSSLDGCWDENDEDLWLKLGDSYLLLHEVPSFNIQTDSKDSI